jgi:hypothetical protein
MGIRHIPRMALAAYQDEGEQIDLRTQEAKPLTRQEFLELFAGISKWYATHTDEEIQALIDQQDERMKREREEWEAPIPKQKKPPKPGVVYLLKCGEHYKIGKSLDYPQRKIQLDTQFSYPTELIHTIGSPDPEELEKRLHCRFHDKRLNGEWFDLSPGDVQELKNL